MDRQLLNDAQWERIAPLLPGKEGDPGLVEPVPDASPEDRRFLIPEVRIREWRNRGGLGHVGDRSVNELSGGQQQRVAIARALVSRPTVMFADEPTGNLDSKNGEAVMELLRELHREGATICMVTHDPRYARHADRSIHLFDGRVVEEDGSKRAEKELEESGFKIEH